MGDSIAVLMAAAMAKIRAVEKDRTFGGPGGFNFRGVDDTVNAVGPVFRECEIVGPLPCLEKIEYDVVETPNKKSMHRVRVQVRYRFMGPNGDEISVVTPGEAIDTGDKATAKAMSVALRIALLQALCLPTQESDPDDFVNGLSELEIAREALITKMRAIKADPNAVLAAYAGLHEGADPRTDTDVARIRDFTANLRRGD